MAIIDRYLALCRSEYENRLANLVGYETVSMESGKEEQISECAKYAVAMLRECGLWAEEIPTSGNPVIAAEYCCDPKARTILLYNHLDVQPADLAEWAHPPFTLVRDGDKYLGRGATDDKGPALALFFAARYARKFGVPLNIQILWEFEEEIGSPNFHEALGKIPFKLRPDSVMISDGLWISESQPSTEYGLRGNLGFEVKIRTAEKDAHSGIVGGLARNPALELANIIAACSDDKGRVKIPGFYDGVRHASSDEVARLVGNGFGIEEVKRDFGLLAVRDMTEESAVRATKTLPTFEVTGITAGYQGEGIKTIVPHEASAKISIRIVPGQTTEGVSKLVMDFIHGLNDRAEVIFEKGLEPYLCDPKGPYIDALSRAVERALGKTCLLDRAGGSIGVVDIMRRHWNVPIVQFGLSLPPHGYHAKDEYFEWRQAVNGAKVFVEYFKNISKI